ncbi:hypothetical protein EDB19DRAFT_1909123 [Suillus lakei]|nr:hypothetical protein EDB19DRAFT_1909123 [Suillus lakei]
MLWNSLVYTLDILACLTNGSRLIHGLLIFSDVSLTNIVLVAPLKEITPHILCLWKARQTDKMIVENLWKVIDTSHYGIGITKFKEIRNAMGLQHTRQQNHSIESIHDTMVDLREAYPNAGVREMVSLLFHEKDMSVSRCREHSVHSPAEAQFTEYVKSPVIRTSDQSLQSSPMKPAQPRHFPALSEPRTRWTTSGPARIPSETRLSYVLSVPSNPTGA